MANQVGPSSGYFWFLLLAGAMLAGVHVVMVWTGPGTGSTVLTHRVLLDTDAYMWLNRVEYLAETGKWFDHTFSRINPPEGHEQHWTRPLDALLLAGGVLLGLAWGFSDGLFYWALALTPLLHLITLVLVVWAARPLIHQGILQSRSFPLLLLVFLAQMPIYQVFLIGRPDHHAPLALLFVAYLGFWLRVVLMGGQRERAGVGLGLVAAVAIWVNVEAILFVALGMAGLGLLWMLGDLEVSRANALHGITLLSAAVGAVILEWGPHALAVRATDTLSVPHLGLLGLTAAFWVLLWQVTERGQASTIGSRAAIAATAAAGVLGGLALMFPEFYASPLGEVDELYLETRLRLLDELQPITALGHGFLDSAGMVLRLAGTGIVTLIYLLILAARAADRRERVAWITMGVLTAVFLVLALMQRRWTDYLALTSVLPFAVFAAHVLQITSERLRPRLLRVARPGVLILLLIGPEVGGMGMNALAQTSVPGPAGESEAWALQWVEDFRFVPGSPLEAAEPGAICDLVEVGDVLTRDPAFAETKLILAHTDYGPELLYRTHHDVLSIPNHRPQPGYRFTHRVMGEHDPSRAAALLRERGVGILFLCLNDIASGFYRYPGQDQTFARWLAEGGVPDGYELHHATPFLRIYRREMEDQSSRAPASEPFPEPSRGADD